MPALIQAAHAASPGKSFKVRPSLRAASPVRYGADILHRRRTEWRLLSSPTMAVTEPTAGPDRRQRWPSRLWLVRHGESAGNIASEAARQSGETHVDIASRDADVELSERGIEQSRALGRWFAAHAPDERPQIVLSSPY